MLIIGCDFHTRYQQIAMLDDGTGEIVERRLEHENGEADRFYRGLPKPVRVGVEATGPLHWFEAGGASYRCLLRKHYTQGLRNYTRSMGLPSIWLARCWIEAATGNVSQHLSYDPRANHEGAARLGL